MDVSVLNQAEASSADPRWFGPMAEPGGVNRTDFHEAATGADLRTRLAGFCTDAPPACR